MKQIVITLIIFSTSTATAMAQPDFYHLNVNSENVKLHISVNGMPVYETDNEFSSTGSAPVQLFLVGKDNLLEVNADRVNYDNPGSFQVTIEPLSQGDYADTGDSDNAIVYMNEELTEGEQIHTYRFDNEGHNYSYIFREAEVLAEEEALDYGKKLYDILLRGDAKSFVGEMPYRTRDYAGNYKMKEEDINKMLSNQLQETFFDKKHKKDAEITALGYSDGRVWEIKVDKHPFLYLKEDTGEATMQVFIAKIDGKFTIVR